MKGVVFLFSLSLSLLAGVASFARAVALPRVAPVFTAEQTQPILVQRVAVDILAWISPPACVLTLTAGVGRLYVTVTVVVIVTRVAV